MFKVLIAAAIVATVAQADSEYSRQINDHADISVRRIVYDDAEMTAFASTAAMVAAVAALTY